MVTTSYICLISTIFESIKITEQSGYSIQCKPARRSGIALKSFLKTVAMDNTSDNSESCLPNQAEIKIK